MAFRKAQELLRLAEMAGSRYRGVSLNDVCDAFGVNQRTAQRMIREFEEAFPSYTCSTDSERRRWWKISDMTMTRMQGVRDSELAALDMAIRRAKRDSAELDVRALASLRDRLLASMPSTHARRAEADAAAMLEAQGFACRPGPRAKVSPDVVGAIAVGIKAPFSIEMAYQGARDAAPRTRKVEPYGLLMGTRQYLVARDIESGREYRRYRIDRISHANIMDLSRICAAPSARLGHLAFEGQGAFTSQC